MDDVGTLNREELVGLLHATREDWYLLNRRIRELERQLAATLAILDTRTDEAEAWKTEARRAKRQ